MKKSAKKAMRSEGVNVDENVSKETGEVWEIIDDREVKPKITEGIIIDDGEEVKEFDVEDVEGYTDRFGNTFETYRQTSNRSQSG